MKQYHIVLSEEEMNKIETALLNYDYSYAEHQDIVRKFIGAKTKKYTNFEKIKNEMTIEDVCKEQVCEIIVKTSKVGKEWCKNKFKQFEGECPESGCEDCCKKWLESETNSELL